MKDLSIYIHIPFCKSKCKYCDFTSFAGNDYLIESYMTSLMEEMKLYDYLLKKANIKTVFFGGGTPSAVDSNYILKIMDHLRANYKMDSMAEVSLELNPGSVDLEKVEIYKRAGINRISMGAQTFNNEILKSLGRIHEEEDIYKTVRMLRENEIHNINLDLMFSLPNQGLEDMKESIYKAIELDLDHISNYSLILEEGTTLFDEFRAGKYKEIDEELDRLMYEESNAILSQAGYDHYEISNFAKKGYECRHNLVYWNIDDYLGLGLSSHSNHSGKRFANTSDIKEYMDFIRDGKYPVIEEELIEKEEEISEYVIMGFRKLEGINLENFHERFKLDFLEYFSLEIEKNMKSGLIEFQDGFIRLSKKGLNLSNQVEIDFYR